MCLISPLTSFSTARARIAAAGIIILLDQAPGRDAECSLMRFKT
jgi:hypothetical protein